MQLHISSKIQSKCLERHKYKCFFKVYCPCWGEPGLNLIKHPWNKSNSHLKMIIPNSWFAVLLSHFIQQATWMLMHTSAVTRSDALCAWSQAQHGVQLCFMSSWFIGIDWSWSLNLVTLMKYWSAMLSSPATCGEELGSSELCHTLKINSHLFLWVWHGQLECFFSKHKD